MIESVHGRDAVAEILISPTAELAWRQLATFFFDRDVHVTPKVTVLL